MAPTTTPGRSLPPEALRRRCDPAGLPFETTTELTDPPRGVGQERAVEAIRFAIAMRRDGYNLYALGPAGVGKHAVVQELLEAQAAMEPVPGDWCYVHNFAEAHRPRALPLPAGRAPGFRKDMERLVADLRAAIPAAFDSDDYRGRRKAIEEQFRGRNEQAFAEIQKHAAERNIMVLKTPVGVAFAPSRNGEVIEPQEFEQLPEADRDRYKGEMKALQDELQTILEALPGWEREQRERVRRLDREVTTFAVARPLKELRAKYADVLVVQEYLDDVRRDVIDRADEFRAREESAEKGLAGALVAAAGVNHGRSFRRYEVNVLVEHHPGRGAPVVYEDYPTPPNLIGRVEHHSEMGALVTDFQLIKAGALHRANGGYLILDAHKLLMQGFSWEQLKRALRSRRVRIESVAQTLSLVSTVSLEPEPIPLSVKVVLVGERNLYYLLTAYDPDFPDLFKVSADFDDRLRRDAEGESIYAHLLASMSRRDSLLPLDRTGVARAIDHGSQLAGDSERLSVQLESLADLVREADHHARLAGRSAIGAAEVQSALDAQVRRSDRVRERMHEEIGRGTILIDTEGSQVGQVNGLSVLQLGGFSFGRPNRVTARVRLGTGKVVDIEREVALGGALHSKGVLILGGYLTSRYASDKPLALSASLVFEQSYGPIDGDSASLAELVALVSALADAPVRQSLAVTGSVNQRGQVQAIGGVNHKIEGFFDVCRARGLRGDEGVVIPASNVKHLMLRDDVVAAVAEGRFSVFAASTVDEAIELLTGELPGERGEDGTFPEGSVNRRAEEKLTMFAERSRSFGRPPAKNEGNGN